MVEQVSSLHGTTVAFRWNVFLWLLFCCTAAHAGTFSTAIDRNALRLGEQATLTLRFDGGLPSDVPHLPDVPNLQFKFGGQNQQIAVINGQRTASLLLNYLVTADKPGDYTIPAFNVPVAGTMLPSQPLTLKVHPADAKLPDTSVSTEKRPTNAPSAPPRTNTPSTELQEPRDFGGALNFGGSSGSHGRVKADPLNDILKKAIAAGVFISVVLLVKFFIFGRK